MVNIRSSLSCIALVVFSLIGNLSAAQGSAAKDNQEASTDKINQVLILHSYSQHYPWTLSQHNGFVESISTSSVGLIAFSTEHLDTKRVAYDVEYQVMFSRYLERKYGGYEPDLIYVTDDNALHFALNYLPDHFKSVPVIFSGVNDFQKIQSLDRKQFVGVFENKEIKPNIELLLTVDPNLNEILVVGDGSGTDKVIKAEIEEELSDVEGLNAIYIEEKDAETLVSRLSERQEKYLLLTTIGGIRSSENKELALSDIIEKIVTAGDFIVMSMEDAYLFDGVIGGYVTNGRVQGEKASELAASYFSGRAINELQMVITDTNSYVFDDRLLRKYQVDLPDIIREQALISNLPESWYEKNRSMVIGALITLSAAVFILLGVFTWTLSRKNKQIQSRTQLIERNKKQELQRLRKVETFQDALVELSQKNSTSLIDALNHATRISSETMLVQQVSAWRFEDDRNSIVCQSQYVLGKGLSDPDVKMCRRDYPGYFKAVDSGRLLVIDDVSENPITSEIHDGYLAPNNISSMLDVPIFYQGECVGVICHEHVGAKRTWTTDEQEFAYAVAKTMSLSLEIFKRKKIERELEHQAYHDALTGLPNRVLLIDRLNQAVLQASRSDNLVAVIYIDLDNFKHVNDSLGHGVGDQLLVRISKILRHHVREMDTISRVGGDEFIMVMYPFSSVSQVSDVATMIHRALQTPIVVDEHEILATASIGVSISPDNGDCAETLIKNADAAMYHAKNDGRNKFHFYTQEMTEHAMARIQLEASLRKAITNNEFVVFYQPQYDLYKKKLIGFEALVRWLHPEKGLVAPIEFVPLAEEVGLIVQIDRFVMEQSLKQFSAWHAEGWDVGILSLNLSAKQLDQDDFFDKVATQLKAQNFVPAMLNFEVTESSIMKDSAKAIKLLEQLGDLGIGISIDDFGTGYSSLEYLKNLPVDKLKIDKSFVYDLPKDESNASITKAIIALASNLNLSVIAEGVEDEAQAQFLMDNGCDEVQGYLYGKPMDVETIDATLADIMSL
jgi:diguanylate cyclase (GGDEF)-like protein